MKYHHFFFFELIKKTIFRTELIKIIIMKKIHRLKLNKVQISKINNLNLIIGGWTQTDLEHTQQVSCEPRETCEHSHCATTVTTTDTTDGEVTGIGGRTTSMNMG